ncbi:MAG: hypothetical protein N5P05_003664 [Chroococcopsis gigantea SAG 12.99]|jgi:cyclophilin family peptidyl-prolyl cis-trans isomerase|nr:peptidylprolyl isomerase [Chlorogloea purpurea SAG 13.99]MDV3002058.1 hypothetical protein [Chroococcopsis gigantea SAG 12.99]
MAINPILINPIPDQDIITGTNTTGISINLSNYFDDPSTTGLIASFTLQDETIGVGQINALLFDQPGFGAPLTVQNFANYVYKGAYTNSFIHRSVPGFVVQGGGFTIDQDLNPTAIPTDPPVVNEFNPIRSNVRGTLAMAKTSDPNSATSQWFFNLADNSQSLNSPSNSGGFTVFGQVLSQDDLNTIDAIASVPVYNSGGVFSQLPLLQNPPNSPDDLVVFNDVSIYDAEELSFTPVQNSNPSLIEVNTDGSNLTLNYAPGQYGRAQVTVSATTLLGQSIDYTFNVTVVDPIEYAASNPDIIPVYGYNPEAYAQHYLNFAKTNGRSIDSFDAKRYLASYDDLLNKYGNDPGAATLHYVQYGAIPPENRDPKLFDPAQYLASHDDLLNTFGSNTSLAQDHFLNTWADEHRVRDKFQEDIYIASYPDLIENLGYNLQAATDHFINRGFPIEHRARQIFDPAAYLNKYTDLQAAYGNDLRAATEHYIRSGYNEIYNLHTR